MSEISKELSCQYCNEKIAASDVFCGQCGQPIDEKSEVKEDVFNALQPALLYYFITFLLLATYKLTSFFPEGFDGFILVSVIDVLIVLVFWHHNFDELRELWSLKKIKIGLITVTILFAVLAALVVSLIAAFLNRSIYEEVYYETTLYEESPFPFLVATLLVAVQPAIFEEVAFRGFLFNYLKKVTTPTSAIYVTAFLFGVIHLQFISLLWLIPMGLIFAYSRNRYNTLWYGVFGHFAYNFTITAINFWNVG
ncbi:MAG: CPBP family intramembrane metalloprotease [Cyclobacteriaceae bacterium]|nr:CPBP family intramembrane metalloprotease [Cyclobacteriaceae bacterium]